MTDLDRLIEAVEAGAIPGVDTHGRYLAFIKLWDAAGLSRVWGQDGHIAYNGSLDAALRLHEALLPGWDYSVGAGPIQGTEGFVYLTGWQKGEVDAESSSPARAWLLAILRAVKAKGA